MEYKLEQPLHASIGAVKYACTIRWRNGILIADEPVSAGGLDTGPDPYSLLLSSLASCILITLRMYIDRKGWDITGIEVDVNLSRNKKEDNTISTVIDTGIRIQQPVTDEQRERLMVISRSCPVSKMLEGEIKTTTYAIV